MFCRSGTSMISLIVPAKQQITQISTQLTDELGTASNIKSRVNRQSVQAAIISAQQRLRLYSRTPPNGLVIYCGTVITEDGKEKLINIDFEPFKPINTKLYLCDSRFHVEPLTELLEDGSKFGFIIIDGKGCLYGLLSGNTRSILHHFPVELPKKHGRGGQSAQRFGRIREEKRHNYVHKVAEKATQLFITDNKINVTGLVLAGAAELKDDLEKSDLFDPRLKSKVIHSVDVAYGGENGFAQAISLSRKHLDNVKVVHEQELISRFFEEIAQDTGKFVSGVEETLRALEDGAVETLIVWEDIKVKRFVLQNSTGVESVRYLSPKQEEDRTNFLDKETGVEMNQVSDGPMVEWLAEIYSNHGATLEFISDGTPETVQFIQGFGGIGGILRWKREDYDIAGSESDGYFQKGDVDDEYAEFF
ncbi:Electron transfer flavoprotein alpha-subunit [Coemansia sp. RSA 2711]|nr:Electron transfer flavoprotein alpha-subunit [Coemansia sp. RSA 2711]